MSKGGDQAKSPNYGGRLGYGIFQWVVRFLGVVPAYALLAFIVPYYALVRAGARRSARPYLAHRFPRKGSLGRFFASLIHFYRFGQVLIDQGAMGILGPGHFHVDFPDEGRIREITQRGRGLVLVTSHVGNWQTAMSSTRCLDVPVSFQFRREHHTEGRHFFDLAGRSADFRLISPDAFLGGMVELCLALRRGECVAVMGDRAFGGRTMRASFFGEPAAFPVSPYYLAHVTGSEIVALLTVRTGRLRYRLECHDLTEGLDSGPVSRDEAIGRLLSRYIGCLERHMEKHPFMWFNFFDFWKTGEE